MGGRVVWWTQRRAAHPAQHPQRQCGQKLVSLRATYAQTGRPDGEHEEAFASTAQGAVHRDQVWPSWNVPLYGLEVCVDWLKRVHLAAPVQICVIACLLTGERAGVQDAPVQQQSSLDDESDHALKSSLEPIAFTWYHAPRRARRLARSLALARLHAVGSHRRCTPPLFTPPLGH
eukprot:2366279-Prymnesium_polylepis.1